MLPHHHTDMVLPHHFPRSSTIRLLFHQLSPLHVCQRHFFFCLQVFVETLLTQVSRVCFITFIQHHRHQLPTAEGLFALKLRTLCFSHIMLCFFGFHSNHFPFRTSDLLSLVEHPSSSSRELCFYLLVAAFAIQVHESAIRHDNDFGTSASLSGSRLHSLSTVFVASSLVGHSDLFLGSFLAPCSLYASSFSFWYILKSCSFSANCEASSVFVCTNSFISSMT